MDRSTDFLPDVTAGYIARAGERLAMHLVQLMRLRLKMRLNRCMIRKFQLIFLI